MTALRSILSIAVFALAAGGCYPQTAAAQTFPEPVEVAGPPGGQMDPQDPQPAPGYDDQAQNDGYAPPGDDQGYAPQGDGAEVQVGVNVEGQIGDAPTSDVQDQGMGPVDDQEIDQTLAGQGQWIDVDGYGRVWRPDATVVGADFTPYETGGSWVDTDAGWSFACDDYSWGWLPFHYGRWGWFDGYWGWQPGYQYGVSWVDWRHGGGYTGWRPRAPVVHDHRTHALPEHDAHWRFAADGDLARGHIRSHLFNNPAEALRVTQAAQGPGFHAGPTVRAAALMHNRVDVRQRQGGAAVRGNGSWDTRNVGAGRPSNESWRGQPSQRDREAPTWQNHQPSRQSFRQPTGPSQPQQGYRQPSQGYRPQPASRPSQSYRQPPAYRPSPSMTSRNPAPSRMPSPSHAPSSSFRSSGGSHSSGGGSHSSGGGSHSSGGGSHSSGGGGHRR